MNTRKLLGFGLATAGVFATTLLADVKPADAFVVHNGWNYTMDAYNDSTPIKKDGSGLFEIRGAAHKVIGDTVVFAVNSNVELENGVDWNRAADKKIHFSDLLINFTGKSLDQANGDLFAVNFAANGDSDAGVLGGVGVYSNVTAKSVAKSNNGWGKLKSYNKYVQKKGITVTHGELDSRGRLADGTTFENGTRSNGTIKTTDQYFNHNKNTVNVIDSGTKIGDIEYIEDLTNLGLDFEHFGNVGSETIAFSFDLGLFPSDAVEAMFHFAMECNNDIVAGRMNLEPGATEVPTPAAILPVILGMFGAASRKKDVEVVDS